MPEIKVGISFPHGFLHKMDRDRRDVSHYRCISKILGWSYNKSKIDSLEFRASKTKSSESIR